MAKTTKPAAGVGAQANDRKFVVALGRGLAILDALAGIDVWLSNGEVAMRVGLPRPTTSRLLQSLTQDGYLHYSERRRRYRLASGTLALGFAARDGHGIGDVVIPFLRRLADTYNVHASLVGRDRLDAVQLEVFHSRSTLMTLQLEVGSRIPLAGTATGHAILAALPEAECKYIIDHLARRHTKHWGSIRAGIEAGLAEHASRGYTTSKAGWMTDINGVAVGFVLPGGTGALALSCGAASRHLPRAKMDEIGQVLKTMVADITKRLERNDASFGAPERKPQQRTRNASLKRTRSLA
jgi:DNA-binding IclR family transcriptional regulator